MKKLPVGLFALAAIALASLALPSCSKSNNSNNGTAVTKENIAGTYMLTALTVAIPGLPAQNIYDSVPACQRDDKFTFNTDMSFVYTDAGTQCVPPGSYSSTWALSGTSISIDTVSGTIQKFDGKNLVVSSSITYMGIPATTTETLTKQ